MAHLLPSLHILVEQLHHFAGIEAVGLAQVDKEAAVALFGLARTALAFLSVALFVIAPA